MLLANTGECARIGRKEQLFGIVLEATIMCVGRFRRIGLLGSSCPHGFV